MFSIFVAVAVAGDSVEKITKRRYFMISFSFIFKQPVFNDELQFYLNICCVYLFKKKTLIHTGTTVL